MLKMCLSVQSFLSIFAHKYLYNGKDTYFILQNKNLCIYEDSFGVVLEQRYLEMIAPNFFLLLCFENKPLGIIPILISKTNFENQMMMMND